MKFQISRVSSGTRKPCEEAVLEATTVVEGVFAASPEAYDERFAVRSGSVPPWLSVGTGHRLTDVGMARDFPSTAWFVEISSPEDLVSFAAKYGMVIVDGDGSLLIYDDYLE